MSRGRRAVAMPVRGRTKRGKRSSAGAEERTATATSPRSRRGPCIPAGSRWIRRSGCAPRSSSVRPRSDAPIRSRTGTCCASRRSTTATASCAACRSARVRPARCSRRADRPGSTSPAADHWGRASDRASADRNRAPREVVRASGFLQRDARSARDVPRRRRERRMDALLRRPIFLHRRISQRGLPRGCTRSPRGFAICAACELLWSSSPA